MTDNFTNRGKFRVNRDGWAALSLRWAVFTGTSVGTDEPDLNTVAELDAVSGVAIHTERLSVGTVTVTEDDTNNRANIDSSSPTFAAASGVTAQGLALYDEGSGTDATRDLIAVFRTGFPKPMDGGLLVNVNDFARTP